MGSRRVSEGPEGRGRDLRTERSLRGLGSGWARSEKEGLGRTRLGVEARGRKRNLEAGGFTIEAGLRTEVEQGESSWRMKTWSRSLVQAWSRPGFSKSSV